MRAGLKGFSSRRMSIKHKLTWIVMLTSGFALLLASMTILTYDVITARAAMADRLSTLSGMIASNSTAALAFDDPSLAQENLAKTLYNMVGFQTNLTYEEQRRVFRMIPGLQDAEFVQLGQMHRNTYINAPAALQATTSFSRAKSDSAPSSVRSVPRSAV